ncbi:hypothetical protein BC828DRAFT_46582 [Blastocladiella britannica]|nr:hypothetical protein BC828DRAFT_46582 [Blastocladiella britannica]
MTCGSSKSLLRNMPSTDRDINAEIPPPVTSKLWRDNCWCCAWIANARDDPPSIPSVDDVRVCGPAAAAPRPRDAGTSGGGGAGTVAANNWPGRRTVVPSPTTTTVDARSGSTMSAAVESDRTESAMGGRGKSPLSSGIRVKSNERDSPACLFHRL